MDILDKIKWLRKNAITEICNLPPGPGKCVHITIITNPDSGAGRCFGENQIDKAIEFVKQQKKETAAQLTLF
jgi:hypothetical protein